MSRFVFLDRDGTLVRDAGYTHRLEDYALLPGVVEGLRRLSEAGFRLAVVTNQSGIGRGYYDEAGYRAFEEHLEADLHAHGVSIERSYHCPHRPEEGCPCRKPEPGLLHRARRELGAELEESFVIGDGEVDVGLARRAGCRGVVWLQPPAGPGDLRHPGVPRARDLFEAARLLCEAGDQGAP